MWVSSLCQIEARDCPTSRGEHSQQTQSSLSFPETLDSTHIAMSSIAGHNISPFVAIHLQELLSGNLCPWHSLKGSGPAWMRWMRGLLQAQLCAATFLDT